MDDCNYADMNKVEKSNAYKMVQHVCTHHNFTAFLASHSLTQLIPRLRRACDIMMLWPPTTVLRGWPVPYPPAICVHQQPVARCH